MKEFDPSLFALHTGSRYRTPIDLQVTPDSGLRFLVVGGCLAQPFQEVAAMINSDFKSDFLLLNNFDSFPEISAERASRYDFQIIHIPLRSIFGSSYFRLPDDEKSHEDFLGETQDYLAHYLAGVVKLNIEHKLLTFVLGFMVPQQNQMGRLQPRYDLRNVMYFIERLNMFLAAEVSKLQNAYFVDIDQVSAGIGKKSCQDDGVWSFTHGTTLSDGDRDHDRNRIEPPRPMTQHYSARWLEFFEALLHEIFAMHRTISQRDIVKLVAVDLDDTLWRGVAAEGTLGVLEGWPMGFIETLLILKKRGILLAIVSKNNEEFIRSNWDHLVQGRIALEDFAVHKINFKSKIENLAEVLQEINLRPQNTVMIDDNPTERASIEAGLPGVRVLGSHPYYLKRILLWSAEAQRCAITEESVRKTEMVHAQLQRESVRKTLSHEEFLKTLGLCVSLSTLREIVDLRMARTLELFNKTNQFNTTGERYTLEECHRNFAAGREVYAIEAKDRFTQYGLIGAAWVWQNCVVHLVMSCRALGLGIEDAFLAHLANRLIRRNTTVMFAQLRPTEVNMACRPVFSRNGFTLLTEKSFLWSRSLAAPFVAPPHVLLTVSGGVSPQTGCQAPTCPAGCAGGSSDGSPHRLPGDVFTEVSSRSNRVRGLGGVA
ncbi:MAG: HAD-IIIC family phosphatase [Syntrophobacteraceae bacterium]|nr:HAD-IIIC family phosphatase [Syntrophobacteraceae bacterium]